MIWVYLIFGLIVACILLGVANIILTKYKKKLLARKQYEEENKEERKGD